MTDNDLPEGWVNAPLSEIVQRVPNVSPESEPNREFGYVDISSICNQSFRVIEPKRFKGAEAPSRARRPIKTGDVLFSNVRTYLRNIALVTDDVSAELCSTGFTVLRPTAAVEPHYLFRYVLTDQFIDRVTPKQTGTHYPATSDRAILEESIPLPPLAEQKRIVAKLEELLARVNAGRERLEKVPAILKRFRQSLLAAACSGRLTDDWREGTACNRENLDEDASCDLFDGRNADVDAPWHVETLPDLPQGWRWRPLKSLGADPSNTVQTGPFGAQLDRDEFVEEGVPVIAVGNLTGMGFTEDGLYYVTEQKAAQLARYDVNAGDVLFARSGATLGKVCVAPAKAKDWRMTGHILRARLNRGDAVPEYIVYCLHAAPVVRQQVAGNVRGITRPGFNTQLLESIHLPIPPIAEQREIVARVEQFCSYVDAIEARTRATRQCAEKLAESVLARAFRGELVANEAELAQREGRAFEPASMLLERIRSERTTCENGPSPPRRKRITAPTNDTSAGMQSGDAGQDGTPALKAATLVGTARPLQAIEADIVICNGKPGDRNRVKTAPPIDDTDRNEVLAVIRQVFSDGARRDRATAIRDVAHALGYRRTGARIEDVLKTDLLTAVRRGILENDRGELRLFCRSADDYTLDHRVEMLLAAMGSGWQTRDEAITAAARHLGFRRTGPAIHAALKSAINAALRRGLLERDGAQRIRKQRSGNP